MPTLAELTHKTKVAEEIWLTVHRPGNITATYPVWFVHDGERLYILSAESASEVWDVKRNPAVDIAVGAAAGPDRIAMTADVMTDPAWVPQMLGMLRNKYGAAHPERRERTAAAAAGGHVIIKLKPRA